jgi:hypothetical protein
VSVGEFGSDLLRRLLERLVDSVDGAVGAGVGVVTGTGGPGGADGADGPQGRQGRAVAGVGVAPELDRAAGTPGPARCSTPPPGSPCSCRTPARRTGWPRGDGGGVER